MGFSKRGDRLRGFVNSKAMADYPGRELRQKLENSLVFQQKGAAAGSIIQTANGYDATLLIALRNSVIAARQLRSPQPRPRRHREGGYRSP
jgi:hypothetical protein